MTAHDLEPLCVGDRVQQVNTFERFGRIQKRVGRRVWVKWDDGGYSEESVIKVFAAPDSKQIARLAAKFKRQNLRAMRAMVSTMDMREKSRA